MGLKIPIPPQPYPSTGRKWQISTEGGRMPVWAPDGRELFFRDEKRVMVVSIRTDPTFSAGAPKLLFEDTSLIAPVYGFDVARDGQRLLMVKSEEGSAPTQIRVILNWFEEMKRHAPD